MNLSIREKSNIRHFIYYLVNGSLDYGLLNHQLGDYYEMLKNNPDIFYKTCCVFINKETTEKPDWPPTKRLAQFICKTIQPEKFKNFEDFTLSEKNAEIKSSDLKSEFKAFSKWFSIDNESSSFMENVKYVDLIEGGASFVEQCFAIWANVIEIENGLVVNRNHAIERVKEYMKSYFIPKYRDNLEDWERELYMF